MAAAVCLCKGVCWDSFYLKVKLWGCRDYIIPYTIVIYCNMYRCKTPEEGSSRDCGEGFIMNELCV